MNTRLYFMARQLAVALWLMALSAARADLNDIALKVVTDNTGNVIVAGYSQDGGGWSVIKYSGAGAPLWTNRYLATAIDNGFATALAVDGNGDVLVTGGSIAIINLDYATIKYSGAGVPIWTNRYNGPQDYDDYATAVAVDGSGNVFVTGFSATIKYSSAGVALWTNSSIGTAIAVDYSGNVFVTGGSGDYETIKYSSAGAASWINRYDGPVSDDDHATAIAVDGSGNVFVTGYSGSGNKSDYATIAYSSAGVALWTNRYSAPGDGWDFARAIALDGSGNVFVTGDSDASDIPDYATIAYSNGGAALWTNRYNGPGNRNDTATALAVDQNGNVLVTGYSDNSGYLDYATIKYSGGGVALWTNRYSGPANGSDEAQSVAVDCSGNVFVTGNSGNSSGSGSLNDYATIKYSSAGVPLWTNRYDGTRNDNATVPEPNHPPVAKARFSPAVVALPKATNPVVIAPDNLSATVVFDGSLSSDPDNDPLEYSWLEQGQTQPFSHGVLVTNVLSLGSHPIVLTVSDGTETSSDMINVEVITPAEAVASSLLAQVQSGIIARNRQPLVATLDAAMKAFERGNQTSALNQLHVFQHKVRAQVERSDPALSRLFLDTTQTIIDAVTGTGSIKLPWGVLAGAINPANWHRYFLLPESTWTEAEAMAETLGGTLAFINDEAENQWVFDTFSEFGGVGRGLWIGLTDQAVEGQFRWVDGTPLTFQRWAPGEPNNNDGGENWVLIFYPQDTAGRAPGWNDSPNVSGNDATSSGQGWIPYNGVVEVIP